MEGYTANLPTSQPWLSLASYLAFSIGGAIAIVTTGCRLALKLSQNDLEWADFVIRSSHPSLAWGYGAELARLLSHSITKISLAVLYLRIFSGKWKPRAAGWVVFTAISVYTIAISGLLIYRICVSTSVTTTTNDLTPGTLNLSIAATGAGIITDLLLVILPIPTVLRLQMKLKEQCKVICILCSPIAATTVSSFRVCFLSRLPGSSYPAKSAAMAIILL
ncbi:integral membrane protein [Colletotrichum tofieldiae]|nr:integral membrane protein [Colletotrichum tofieldiae]